MNEPQWTYQDIVNHFVKIIGNGTFTVETINESILLKMLDSKGIKIPVEKSYRDIDKDYKMYLQDIGITMNEPQLSAEIEQQFDKEFGYLSVAIDYYVENAYPLRKESGMKHLRDIKQFLATALEEQRLQYVRKVEGYYGHIENDGVTGKPLVVSREDILKDIFAIFNGKDTNEK